MTAAARFQRLASGLRSIASGAPAQRAAARLVPEVLAVARAALAGHSRSGNALSSLTVTGTAEGVSVAFPAYLRFQRWWPFREGVPDELAARYRQLLAEEIARDLQ